MDAENRFLALAERIDPERAKELGRELGRSENRAPVVLLATAFPPFAELAPYRLEALERLSRDGLRAGRHRDDLFTLARRAVAKTEGGEAFAGALRRFAWTERARIALRELLPLELGGASIATTAHELSLLAEVTIELALEEAVHHVASRTGLAERANGEPSALVVFGMGKLGGGELNAGSDVDLNFVYDTDDSRGEPSLHDHWTRVVRRLVGTLETPTQDGIVWRVDLRLRPEGSRGALVNSMAATERYYETWGRLWERAALLRARPVAGDRALGAAVGREVFTPFVYRHAVDPTVALGMADMVERSRRELSEDPARDLKLGPGGIRELEFFAQTLQLVFGGRTPALRVQGTLEALSRLKSAGMVSDREARALAEAHAFLRRLEHRVQWISGIQTHLVPREADDLARLARTLGYADERPMLSELERMRARVSALFATVLPAGRLRKPSPRFSNLLAALADSEAAAREAEGLFESADVSQHLVALSRRPDGPLGELTRERRPGFAEALLGAVADCPDPELSARNLRGFFGRFSDPSAYVGALAEDPYALSRLVTVLGSSRFVGDALIARPDLSDVILFGGGAVSDPRAAVLLELETHRDALPSAADDEEAQEAFVTALRVAKRRVMVEVAVADLGGSIGTREATRLLSDLADATVEQATDRVLGSSARGLAVLALGKLGGRDLGYGSDLDVIFVFDPSAAPNRDEAMSYFSRAAQRIIRYISEPGLAGPGYELDTRLRPSGSKGMLVTSLGAFARYHGIVTPEAEAAGPSPTSSGAAWERQTLLRARFCAGDGELGARALAVARAAAYEGGAPPVDEMHRLRLRMERELGRERPGRYDLKTGRGGLLDIEFCVQWLQMRHGADTRVRTTDTAEALEALFSAGYLEHGGFDQLREGYRFLRRLEQRIHVLTGQSASVIDTEAPGLSQLARRMGFSDEPGHPAAELLVTQYRLIVDSVRDAYLSALELEERA
jgi:[glutamine synthetase] adenylyltransferase / [glutamine synthetase]-adenylyl-L-tyrosine phosphorylase